MVLPLFFLMLRFILRDFLLRFVALFFFFKLPGSSVVLLCAIFQQVLSRLQPSFYFLSRKCGPAGHLIAIPPLFFFFFLPMLMFFSNCFFYMKTDPGWNSRVCLLWESLEKRGSW